MNHPPRLQMRGIAKRFPGVIALADVHLTVGCGEVVALCLCGIWRRDAATTRRRGRQRYIIYENTLA